jgi:hypothetical protein
MQLAKRFIIQRLGEDIG